MLDVLSYFKLINIYNNVLYGQYDDRSIFGNFYFQENRILSKEVQKIIKYDTDVFYRMKILA